MNRDSLDARSGGAQLSDAQSSVSRESTGRRRSWALSRVLVTALAVWALLDIAGRLAPLHWLHIIPEFEASHWPAPYSPFAPNLSITHENWVGEETLTSNVPPTQVRPAIRFTTDEFGYRRTPGFDPARGADLIFYEGASYVYGAGLSDDETIAAAMNRRGISSYNAGRPFWSPMDAASFDWLVSKLGPGRKDVVAVIWEDADLWPNAPRWPERVLSHTLGSAYRPMRDTYDRVTGVLRISPLEVLSIRAFKALSNDVILPNRYKTLSEARWTPRGDRVLFSHREIQHAKNRPTDAELNRNTDYLLQLAQLTADRHLKLYVILVPDRYTVYGARLDRSRSVPPSDYLDRMERRLVEHNIRAMNATELMRQNAEADLTSGELAYNREDHHWSPKGVERVASAFQQFLTAREAASIGGANALQ